MPRDATDEHPSDEEPTPEDAFALVGNPIRAEMLGLIADAGELTFSELRSRTARDLAPAQVNYHLQQLLGPLVKKTDEGYRLYSEAYRVIRVLRAVTFQPRRDHRTVSAGFDCYYCQTPVEATFDSGLVAIQCSKCEYPYAHDLVEIPLHRLEDGVAVFAQVSKSLQHKVLSFARCLCPTCGYTVETTFRNTDDLSLPKGRRRKVAVYQSCKHCSTWADLTLGMALLADAGLRSFCHDHGIDVFSTPYWELEFAATDAHVTVNSTEPWEVALQVTYDGTTLKLVVDDNVTVIERNLQ